ncbi:tetratricopeptide repeat protein [Falsiroseomonas sp.]|uniref:tetratricopeptide repeat protein n=1 Tax=Falsiroseomonas sp. TaxID=2870721 RepID=UPI003F6FD193
MTAPSPVAEEIAAIERLVAQKPAAGEELSARILAARARWPSQLRLQLLQGTWLEAEGRIDAAVACYRAAQAEHRGNPWPAVRLVELLLRQRRHEEARTVFRDEVWGGGAPERTRTGLLSQTTASIPDPAGREAFLRSLLRQQPDDRFPLLKLAVMRFRQKDRAAAEALFAEAASLGPMTDEAQLILLELHFAAARFEEAHALAQELQARHPDRVEFARRRIQAATFLHRVDEMIALLQVALLRWPEDWLLLFRFNRCPLPGETDRTLFAALTARRDAMAGNDRWLFQYAIASLRHAEPGLAVALVRSLAASPLVGHMAAPLAAALAAHPLDCWANPQAVSHACDEEVQLLTRPDAVATVILFASVAGGLGYLPFGMADGLLRQRPVNVLYLRDTRHRAFTTGIRSLGADHAAMIEALHGMTRPLGVPVLTMGSSIAGVAAIRAAARMQAAAAISFAGPVNLGLDATEEEAPAAAGGTRSSLYASFTEAEPDLVALVRAAPATIVHQCFGADFAPDVEAAQLLAPMANARLHPEPGCADHLVIEHAIASGSFLRILDAALQGAAAA